MLRENKAVTEPIRNTFEMKNRDEMDKRSSGEAERNMGKRGFEITTMATLGGAGEARCPERTRCCERGTAREWERALRGRMSENGKKKISRMSER